MSRLLFLFACVASFPGSAAAQTTIGIPEIISYSNNKYGAGSQNWDIRQDTNGLVYFANNEGVLSFDGTYWKLYPLPNRTIVRSIETGPGNRIYAGGQDEIGYFSPDERGKLVYTSLKKLIPAGHRSFDDTWDIQLAGSNTFFLTRSEIFQFNGRNIVIHTAPSQWMFLGNTGRELLAQDAKMGLMRFRNGGWSPVDGLPLPKGFLITALMPLDTGNCLIATARHGAWLWSSTGLQKLEIKGPALPPITAITSLSKIDDNYFAIGTPANGCLIADRSGQVVQQFREGTGLSNSNVISVLHDKNRNLWLGLDNGIDFIAFDNAIKHIDPPSLDHAAGYSSMLYGDALYLAMSSGAYVLDRPDRKQISASKGNFIKIANSTGQGWGLSRVGGHLFFGSHEGFFDLHGHTAERISGETGYWLFAEYQFASSSPKVLAGNYNGLQVYDASNSGYRLLKSIDHFEESARFLALDRKNNVWSSHPYRGVYRIQPSLSGESGVKLYTAANGLPSAMNNHVYRVKNRVVVATEKGVYEYSAATDRFEPSDYFKPIFGTNSVRYLKEDQDGNIWFIREKELGVVDFSSLTPAVIYFPELKGKMVSGFEHINPLDQNNVLVGGQQGFYHIDFEKYLQHNQRLTVAVRTVQVIGPNDSLLFGGYAQASYQAPEVAYAGNSFHIEYSAPLFEQQSSLEYSYYLKGFEENRTEWTARTEKDYTNLPAGHYEFHVKARNNLGNASPEATFSFIVLPPWYQTYWAYAGYLLAAGCIALLLYRRSQKKFQRQQQEHLKQQQQLQYLHQLEMEQSEKEIVKLKNERLQSQIEDKNSELASTAMHLVQKGEILTKIKDELTRLHKQPGTREMTTNIRKLVKVLNEDDKVNEDWEHFANHFNNVHSDFLIALKERFPKLSAHDLKFCAYLRMNLTSKEIAQLMNISIRGVEIGRYRLRKKLGITTETNLFNFLLNFHSESGFPVYK